MKLSDRFSVDNEKKEEAVSELKRQAANLKRIADEVDDLATLFEENDINCEQEWDRLLHRMDKASCRLFGIEKYLVPISTIRMPLKGPKSTIWTMETAKEYYLFKLPLFTSQRKSRWYNGDYIASIVENLLISNLDVLSENGTWERVQIKFIHHVNPYDDLYHRPDPDNMDVKKAIDTLQDFLIIPNDNLLCINLSHETVLDTESFTIMEVHKIEPL